MANTKGGTHDSPSWPVSFIYHDRSDLPCYRGVLGLLGELKWNFDTLRTCFLLSLSTMFSTVIHIIKINTEREQFAVHKHPSTSARYSTLIPVKSIKIPVMPGSQAGDKVRQPLPRPRAGACGLFG